MGGGPRVVVVDVVDSADTIRIPGVRSVGVGGPSMLGPWDCGWVGVTGDTAMGLGTLTWIEGKRSMDGSCPTCSVCSVVGL